MKRAIQAVGLIAMVAAMSPSLLAQWRDYPLAGAPRNAKGEIDVNAPAPKTADGKPDFSGVWRGVGSAGGGRGAAAPPAPPPSGPPLAGFRDVASNIKGGLPFTPWGADELKKRQAGNSKDNPDAHCLPMGLMQFHTHGQPRKIIQTADLMLMIFEPNYGLRQIFTDGRDFPATQSPTWFGYSLGSWAGDTFVVDTVGFNEGFWLDRGMLPHTQQLHTLERFRRVDLTTLSYELTIDDPGAYTKPFTGKMNLVWEANTELFEYVCQEANYAHNLMVGEATSVDRTSTIVP